MNNNPEIGVDKGPFSFVIITVSDKGAEGKREDTTGPIISKLLTKVGFVKKELIIIPDNKELIKEKICYLADELKVDLVVTNGGTGVSPEDITPEATKEVIDKEIPGMAEAMRSESLKKTPHAMLSRAVCGVRGSTLVVNLPGSPRGAKENLEVIIPALPHAIEKIKGDPSDCAVL